MFDAWHLPGLSTDELTCSSYRLGELDVRAPVLAPQQLTKALAHLHAARARLQQIPTRHIIAAIDAVARRLGDPDSETGRTARQLLPAVTGYSLPVVEDILAHMTDDWQRSSLETLVLLELGSSTGLDHPQHDPAAHRHTIARGPVLTYQIFSGNVPGVAVTALIRCLLVKASQFGKTASREPVLPVLFARALNEIEPTLADSIALCYWPGANVELEEIAIDAANAVVIYGGEETVRAVSMRAGTRARLIVHGPKLSLGIVGRAAQLDVARDIAYAVAAYDQQGCVSPHTVYVEQGGHAHARQFAQAIAASLAQLALSYPRGTIDAAETMAIRDARSRAEFRAITGETTEVYASEDTSYTVIYDEDATLQTSCLNRTLFVKPIQRAQAISELLHSHRGILQSVAIAGFSANQAHALAVLLADCGVTRIASFKALPWPPMWWHHDGRGALRELLTWHDVEAT